MSRLVRSLGIVLVLAATACGGPKIVSLAEPAQPLTADDYWKQINRWTRVGSVRSDFDTDLIIKATLHAPEFRSAYVAKITDIFKVGKDNLDAERAKLFAEVADVWEFHIESAAHRFEFNELGLRKAIWRITLMDDQGHEVLATDVKADRPRRSLEPTLYPYVDDFTKGWRVRFPKNKPDGTPIASPETKTLTLRFAGPPGSTDLVWQLRP